MAMITRNRLLSAFGGDAVRDLLDHSSEVVLPVGKVVFEPGHPITDVYFPTSGVFSLVVMMADGQAVESLTVGREGAVGLVEALGRPLAHQRTVVQIAGAAWSIAPDVLRNLAGRHPSIGEVALLYAQASLAELHQGAACNAVHHIESRLCRWLLACEDRIGDTVVPLTQEYLALMLGVQRTSVTTAAQALQRRGLIRYQRGRITILDNIGLERAACECHRAAEVSYGAILQSSST